MTVSLNAKKVKNNFNQINPRTLSKVHQYKVMMKLENVLIEHFPRLKCANFFLLFNTPFSNITAVKVHLRPGEILIHLDENRVIKIDFATISIEIQINSLSLLIVKNNLISFRINTSTLDHFHEELLPCTHIQPLNVEALKLILNIKPNESFRILCDNCNGPLTNFHSFRRVLELPSENMDLNEWFCHKPHAKATSPEPSHQHHHSRQHQANTAAESNEKYNFTKFTPSQEDLLYGNFFALFNLKNFTNINIDSNSLMIYCQRCLNHIGESLKGKTAKLWNHNFKIITTNSEINCIDEIHSTRLFVGDTLFVNFLVVVDRISKDFQMLGCQSQKILFEAQNFNGSVKFLFLHVMAKNLELYQMCDESEFDRISMKRIDGTKCLFRCEQNGDQALLRFWQNDVNVVGNKLSIEMLNCVVENLNKYTKFVPENFRMNNGFCLSYLSRGIIK